MISIRYPKEHIFVEFAGPYEPTVQRARRAYNLLLSVCDTSHEQPIYLRASQGYNSSSLQHVVEPDFVAL